MEIALENGLSFEERAIRVEELNQAAEVWITSATREILPIVELDGNPVGSGKPGAVWDKMNALYQLNKERLRNPA